MMDKFKESRGKKCLMMALNINKNRNESGENATVMLKEVSDSTEWETSRDLVNLNNVNIEETFFQFIDTTAQSEVLKTGDHLLEGISDLCVPVVEDNISAITSSASLEEIEHAVTTCVVENNEILAQNDEFDDEILLNIPNDCIEIQEIIVPTIIDNVIFEATKPVLMTTEAIGNNIKDIDIHKTNPATSTNNENTDVQYTKKGAIRKRKKYETSVKQRKKAKNDMLVEKYAVKVGCGEECARKCNIKISEDRRKFLNGEFWKLSDEKARKSFILHHISSISVKQRTTIPDTGEHNLYRRNNSFKYMLKNENGACETVCKKFFLATLGFNRNNDRVIRTALINARNSVVPTPSKRCMHVPHNKIDDEVIRQHITSFNPTISHYRREHAPCRIYLPSDLTFTSMHQDFLKKKS